MIREWIIVLRGREKLSAGHGSGQVKIHTLHGYMRALRRFWRWACLEYDIAQNPMDRVRLPQRPRPEPKAISLDDLRAISMPAMTVQKVSVTGRSSPFCAIQAAERVGCWDSPLRIAICNTYGRGL